MFSVAFVMLADAENAEVQQQEKNMQRIERRRLRDAINPLELPQSL